jgi:hypothetical protein
VEELGAGSRTERVETLAEAALSSSVLLTAGYAVGCRPECRTRLSLN